MQQVDLDVLKQSGALWQGRRHCRAGRGGLSTGWPVLDELTGGGWAQAALNEVLSDACQGVSLVLPMLAAADDSRRWQVWVMPPYVPYAPALAARGVRAEQLLLVRDVSESQCLWAAEQALKSGACHAVLLWPGQVRTSQLRRLQLAAEQGGCPCVLFRPARTALESSPAALRLRVRPALPGLEVEVLKRRGAWAGERCLIGLVGGPADAAVWRDGAGVLRSRP